MSNATSMYTYLIYCYLVPFCLFVFESALWRNQQIFWFMDISMDIVSIGEGRGSGGKLTPQFGQIWHLFGQKTKHLFVTIRAKLGLTPQMDVGPYADACQCGEQTRMGKELHTLHLSIMYKTYFSFLSGSLHCLPGGKMAAKRRWKEH